MHERVRTLGLQHHGNYLAEHVQAHLKGRECASALDEVWLRSKGYAYLALTVWHRYQCLPVQALFRD